MSEKKSIKDWSLKECYERFDTKHFNEMDSERECYNPCRTYGSLIKRLCNEFKLNEDNVEWFLRQNKMVLTSEKVVAYGYKGEIELIDYDDPRIKYCDVCREPCTDNGYSNLNVKCQQCEKRIENQCSFCGYCEVDILNPNEVLCPNCSDHLSRKLELYEEQMGG